MVVLSFDLIQNGMVGAVGQRFVHFEEQYPCPPIIPPSFTCVKYFILLIESILFLYWLE